MSKLENMLLICGVKIRIFAGGYKRHKYTISTPTKKESKLEKYLPKGETSDNKTSDRMHENEVLANVPKEVRKEVQSLLGDRNREAEPYFCKIVALDSFFGRRLWTILSRPTKWLIVLRGGVVEKVEHGNEELPRRHSTPWGGSKSSRSLVDDASSATDSSSYSSSIPR